MDDRDPLHALVKASIDADLPTGAPAGLAEVIRAKAAAEKSSRLRRLPLLYHFAPAASILALIVAVAMVANLPAVGGAPQSSAGTASTSAPDCVRYQLLAGAQAAAGEPRREVLQQDGLDALRVEADALDALALKAERAWAGDRRTDGSLEELVAELRFVAQEFRDSVPTVDSDRVNAARDHLAAATATLARPDPVEGSAADGCTFEAFPSTVLAVPIPTRPSQPPVTGPTEVAVTWAELPYPEILRTYYRPAPDVTWVATSQDWRVSEDRGKTWRIVTPPDSAEDPVYSAGAFTGVSRGWILSLDPNAKFHKLWRTDDAGRTWALQPDAPRIAGTLESRSPEFRIAGDRLLITATEGPASVVLYSAETSGTGSWKETRLDRYPYDSLGASFLSLSMATGELEDVEAAFSADDGRTWVTAKLDLPRGATRKQQRYAFPVAYKVLGPDSAMIVVNWSIRGIGARSVVYVTADAGRTWNRKTELDHEIRTVQILDGVRWVAIVDEDFNRLSTWTTADGGGHWTKAQILQFFHSKSEARFIDLKDGWIMVDVDCGSCVLGSAPGRSDELIATRDGGQTWEVVTPPR